MFDRRKFTFGAVAAAALAGMDTSAVQAQTQEAASGPEGVEREELKKRFEALAQVYNDLLKKCDFGSTELSPEEIAGDKQLMDTVDTLFEPFRPAVEAAKKKSPEGPGVSNHPYTLENLPKEHFALMNELVDRAENMLRAMDSVQNKKDSRYTALMHDLADLINEKYAPYCAFS